MLERLLWMCKQPIIESNVTSTDRIVRRVYKERTEGNIEYQVDALILPQDMIWPTFLEAKQQEQRFKNIYFQRQTVIDANRRAYSLDLLRKRGRVVWTGAPGIGKSCEMNHILIELLSHLGEDSWPSMVAFRVDSDLFTFTSSGVTRTRISYDDLHEYSKIHKHDNSVLILELQESEIDPVIGMPFISAVSTINLDSKLKTLRKSANRNFMLISPPDIEEVSLMTEAIMDVCPNNDLFRDKSKEEAVSIVQSRAQKVGAIPRYLFSDADDFEARVIELRESASKSISTVFSELRVNNIPTDAELFVAPYCRPGVTDPNFPRFYHTASPINHHLFSEEDLNERWFTKDSLYNFEFRYLSEFTKQIHFFTCKGREDIETMKRFDFDYQYAESIIAIGGILIPKRTEDIDDRIRSKHWEWHKNIDYTETLSRDSKLPNDMIPALPRSSAVMKFLGMFYMGDVRTLESDRLYRGTFHNLALYEYFNVDHENKIIYLYHVTTGDLSKHSFTMSMISKVMEKLCMFEDGNLEYKVRLLCFCDWRHKVTPGTKFFDTRSERNIVYLNELRAVNDRVAVRLEVFIIRAPLVPTETKFELTYECEEPER